MSQESNPWERKAEQAELRKKGGARTRAGILQSGLLISRRSAKCQRFSAAFVMLPTETGGAVMVAVESQAGEVLFIGQPGYPVATLNELARQADAARRER
jgi:hypothetical protein